MFKKVNKHEHATMFPSILARLSAYINCKDLRSAKKKKEINLAAAHKPN